MTAQWIRPATVNGQGFTIINDGKMVVLFSVEASVGDCVRWGEYPEDESAAHAHTTGPHKGQMCFRSEQTINELSLQLIDTISELELQLIDSDKQLQAHINVQAKELQELRDEISSMQQEIIKERKLRENITLMFGIFSVIVIALNARTRK